MYSCAIRTARDLNRSRVLAVLLVGALLAGCGGSGDSGGDNPIAAPARIERVAGALTAPASRDGHGVAAEFMSVDSLVRDASGNLYVAEAQAHTVRRISPQGDVTTLAGMAGESGSADGTGATSRFARPTGLAIDGRGVLWVTDPGNHTLRTIAPDGTVRTVAGVPGQAGDADGPFGTATLRDPQRVTVAADGSVAFVADTGRCAILRVAADGAVTTLRRGTRSESGCQTLSPLLALSADGRGLYTADPSLGAYGYRYTLRLIDIASGADVTPPSLQYYGAWGTSPMPSMRLAPDGDLVLASMSSEFMSSTPLLDKVSPQGVVTPRFPSARRYGNLDGASDVFRWGSVVDTAPADDGTIFFADGINRSVRALHADGSVTTVAGHSDIGSVNAAALDTRFESIRSIAPQPDGSIWVLDGTTQQAVRRVDGAGAVTQSFPAPRIEAFSAPWMQLMRTRDGALYHFAHVYLTRLGPSRSLAQRLDLATGLWLDPFNPLAPLSNLWFDSALIGADGLLYMNVRSASAGGGASWVVYRRNPNNAFAEAPVKIGEMPGSSVRLQAADGDGNVYYTRDSDPLAVYRLSPAGVSELYAGASGDFGAARGSAEGTRLQARFGGSTMEFPSIGPMAVDAFGNLYLVDQGNCAIRRIRASDGMVSTLAGTPGQCAAEPSEGELPGALADGITDLEVAGDQIYAAYPTAIYRIGPLRK